MSKVFDLLENIDVNNPDSWKKKIFLTFDVDWAIDEVWLETIKILEDYEVPATWFVTHKSHLISRIKKNSNFRIGIHPNFNPLIENDNFSKDINRIIDDFFSFIPDSNIVRSHSLFQSEKILDLFDEKGFNIICNNFIPYNFNGKIFPYKLWKNLLIMPHCWQDNVSLKMKLNLPSVLDQLIILNFHPIHIFLNTKNLRVYDESKIFNKDINKLNDYVNRGYGVKNILIDIIKKYI
jgi:hypothetical protein